MNTPYQGKVIRNLIYHLWPVKDRGVWQWNVSQLLRRMNQFNGQRIVSVVTGPDTDTLDTVKKAFQGTVQDFFETPNNPLLGEVVSFERLMRQVENIDPRQITFYGHAKGVRYAANEQPMVRRWSAVMYANLMDYPALVDDQLRRHPITGAFFKAGPGFQGVGANWHYSGTFFWFRNAEIFNQPTWGNIVRNHFGVESWPGVVCPESQAGKMFYIHRGVGGHLYQRPFWEANVNPAWHQWQLANAELHRHSTYREVLTTLRQLGAKKVFITGPQRSGTTIASKMLARDLGLPWIHESTSKAKETWENDPATLHSFVASQTAFVLQAPTMSAYAHHLPCQVVWMRRNLSDILRSQQRIDWNKHEQAERDRYFDHSHRPAAVIKTDAWEKFQRIQLGERAFDLDYESLQDHPMWVDSENRKGFDCRQTTPYPSKV